LPQARFWMAEVPQMLEAGLANAQMGLQIGK
jgi:hypothetical protein